jgi:hypothetical protein
MISSTALLMVLGFAGHCIFLGNDVLWKNSYSVETKGMLTDIALYFIAASILAFIRLETKSISLRHEMLLNARHCLIMNLLRSESRIDDFGNEVEEMRIVGEEEFGSGKGIGNINYSMYFSVENSTNTANWVRRLLQQDGCCTAHQLGGWLQKLENDRYLRHIKYFIAAIQRDPGAVSEKLEMPMDVVYRLATALEHEWDRWVGY